MANLVTKHGAVDFFSSITEKYESDVGFEESPQEDLGEDCKRKLIRDLQMRTLTATDIIGHRDAKGKYHINPGPDTILQPAGSFIAFGSQEQFTIFREMFSIKATPTKTPI